MINIITRQEAITKGLTRYFLGKKCKHGHISEYLTSCSTCVECHKKHGRKYAQNNKKKRNVYQRKYYSKNKRKINSYRNIYFARRKQTDILFRLKCELRSRTSIALRKHLKSGSSIKDLGCSIDELKLYLESKFQKEMSWNNYGIKGWHIDHIIPLSKFNLSDKNQFLKACHYTNLQPMWAQENIKKGNT